MKRRTKIAAIFVFALTMAMLFTGVVNAHQPAIATEQYRGYGYWGGHPGWGGRWWGGRWWGGYPGWWGGRWWGGYPGWR